ncbi:MAG TPA: hypothetical protein VGP46_08950 [Acidimicrobiales bacterium]|nr:hypothetical protein [Acidimicrobiales bacterium]
MNEFPTHKKLPPRPQRRGPRHRALRGVAGLVVIGTLAAACGSKAATTTTTKASAPAATAANTTAVDTKINSTLGTILVNSQGFTLYRLSTDSMNKSNCDSACEKVWPPVLLNGSGSPVAGTGVSGLGSIKVAAGEQVTYNGMPLYTFTGDSSAGQANGQKLKDTWGTWFVIVTKAPTTTTAPAGGTTTTTAGGGGGIGF